MVHIDNNNAEWIVVSAPAGELLLQTAVKCMPVVQPGQCICKCFGSGLHHGVMEPALLPLHISKPGREGIYTPLKILHQMFGYIAMPTQPQLHPIQSNRYGILELIQIIRALHRLLQMGELLLHLAVDCSAALDQFLSAIANTIDLLVQRLQLLCQLQQKPLHLLSLLLSLHLGVFDQLQ